ncbi:hypothetical protein NL509_27510, partial [Klebsiella pneumoniae]|nr:hypothetical protein [Klebsiella pneumoniae]
LMQKLFFNAEASWCRGSQKEVKEMPLKNRRKKEKKRKRKRKSNTKHSKKSFPKKGEMVILYDDNISFCIRWIRSHHITIFANGHQHGV